MKTIISADDLAKDVAGAESLLEKHQEHKVSIRVPAKNELLFTLRGTLSFCCLS